MILPGEFDHASAEIQELAYQKSSCADAGYLKKAIAATVEAIVAATIANVNRAENQPPFSPKDFLPDFEPREPQTWEAQLSLIEVLNAAFGGKDERPA